MITKQDMKWVKKNWNTKRKVGMGELFMGILDTMIEYHYSQINELVSLKLELEAKRK